jgi:small basic protein
MGVIVTLAGLVFGIAAGIHAPISIPQIYSKYFAVALLAALDTGFGGVRSGLEEKFGLAAFVSGFTANTILAAGLTYLGDQLGIDLYLAAIVVFGVRIFENLAKIRRVILGRFWKF